MQAQYRISEDNYARAVQLAMKAQRARIILSGVALIISGIFILFGIFGVRSETTYIMGAAGLGATLIVALGNYFGIPFLARRQYRKYKMVQEDFTLEVRENGIHLSTAHGTQTILWEHILKWQQSPEMLLIYPAPRLFHIIPTAYTSANFDISVLTEQLKKHVGPPI